MAEPIIYDIACVGGGLAGLTTALNLSMKGHRVVLFEKETYPFHKVCGEYISMESWDYLISLGVPLASMDLPQINQLLVTAPNGQELHAELPLGGFGISRYCLDETLMKLAAEEGVSVHTNCKVEAIGYIDNTFQIQTTDGIFHSKLCCGSFGKRSNLDLKWKRPFILQKPSALNHYIAVKYHINIEAAPRQIALHNFEGGYCGISKIEGNRYCLCYLTTAENLRKSDHSIARMESGILSKNPHLKKIFDTRKNVYAQPLTISQVSFARKSKVENHVLLLGDAAGLIAPLSGNGMSIAMRAGKIASESIDAFLRGHLSREELEKQYAFRWEKQFGKRLATGRLIQRFFGKTWVTNIFITLMKKVPKLTGWMIKQTHGQPF